MTIRARTRTVATTRVATTDPARTQAGRLSPEAAGARLSELFEEHGRMVYGVCRVLLRDRHEAEDAAQQVFLSAHRSMLGGTDPRDAAAWLGTIARHECQGRIRARMATPLALVHERHAASVDVEHVAGQHEEIEAVCAALAELPQQQREAIVLREFYGLSYDEVQAALGVSDAAVESLLFRARKRLQEELRPARVASGAIALPFALRDALAAAVPGFSSGSGGTLAKLASIPLLAKLAGAAATLTAAGTIAYVENDVRDHDVTAPSAHSSVPAEPTRPADRPAARLARAETPVVQHAAKSAARTDRREDKAGESGEVEEHEAGGADGNGDDSLERELETDGESDGGETDSSGEGPGSGEVSESEDAGDSSGPGGSDD
jgi:RNA polymerase sigma-70 factor (ECF subfamily)